MDENKKEIVFREDDFVLIQKDKRVTDKKLDTKPTTFFKDALRRFRKNKASVAGGIIIGMLVLLTIFVPMLSNSNITIVSTPEAFLAPKLFKAGTGFWDGTRKYTRIVYDTVNEVPALSDKYSIESLKAAIVKIVVDEEPTRIDTANAYGQGGVVVLATDAALESKNAIMSSKAFNLDVNGDYKLDVVFSDEQGVSSSEIGEYAVYLKSGDEVIMLRDFSTDYSPLSVNLSKALADAGFDSLRAQVVFEVKSAASNFQYILIESAVISAAETAPNAEDIAGISITDATAFINVSDTGSLSYWSCTGRKGIHDSLIYYCDYTLDTYELVYGDADLVTYSATELNNWIDAGYCTYDYTVGPESFVKLTDDCPIDVVESQTVMGITKKLSSITGRGYRYEKLGYSKMPKFLFGTDASGFDIFKRAFAGLRTSLILGICTAAFTFTFGLIWGSISGYFGGSVDLWMERFCEILGGVPWLVVMTLCILHLGNNFSTFVLALCLTGWIGTAARTRTQFYRFKGREYVLASRTLGSSDVRLIFKHILPNSMGTIITASVLMITDTIYSEATLAYLNLGLQGLQSFGVMMSNNQQYLGVYPNLVIFPAVVMALLMISFNLFGNGLRDAFNPSLKGSE
ncbi:MAG: ABC transporter permease [Lachnospiraceae bacterium]|nr:ABC transporter permease [Lachnospiraceae bacterium]